MAGSVSLAARRRNHALWLGPLVAAFGLLSYFTLFYRWPALRDFPWLNLVLLAIGLALSIVAIRRAWPRGGVWRVTGALGLLVSVAAAGVFVAYCFVLSYALPSESLALQVGEPAPRLVLPDHEGKPFELAAAPGERLLLVFYRGFW